jgi:Uma2 family endonuclease
MELVRAVEGTRRGRVFIAPVDVHLAPGTIVQPDLVVLGARCTSRIGQKKITGAPDLLVEILSPSHRALDTVLKRERYQRAGVRELWLVDPDADTLVQLVLRRGRYVEVATAGPIVRLRALRGPTVDLRAVFD